MKARDLRVVKKKYEMLTKSKALKVGDTVALVRPSSKLDDQKFNLAAQYLRELGFFVAIYPKQTKADSYFSASDEDRAREWSWAFRQPGIKAVFQCRGGYGAQRMISKLSDDEIDLFLPKIFVGYSDGTYLHQWIQNRLGWTSIHGPLGGFMVKSQMKTMIKDLSALAAGPQIQEWPEVKNVGTNAEAIGRLVGGNLSLLQSSGPAAIPKLPIVLAIEDINENFYRIDRMLGSLIDAGYSAHVKGLIVGSLKKCGEADAQTFGIKRLHSRLRELCQGPIWVNARFGHGLKHQRLLPLGCEVRLMRNKFQILEKVFS